MELPDDNSTPNKGGSRVLAGAPERKTDLLAVNSFKVQFGFLKLV